MMTLYYSDTLMPRKTCAFALHLGSPVAFVPVDLTLGEQRTPSYRAMNPNAKVPVLTDGDTVIWESNAIMCHLAMKAGSDLWPRDERQVDLIRWLSWDGEHFTKAGGALYFEFIIRKRFNLGPPDEANVEEARGHFRRFAAVLDDHLAGKDYLVGNALSAADFAVGACLPYASEARLPLHGFDNIARWAGRLDSMPAWRDPFGMAAEAKAA